MKHFYLSSNNTMVFEAPWNGVHSSGGSGPRSELRGTLADGNEDNWLPVGTDTRNVLQPLSHTSGGGFDHAHSSCFALLKIQTT